MEEPTPSKPVDITSDPLAVQLYRAILHSVRELRTLKPSLLTTLSGIPIIGAGESSQFQFKLEDTFVPVFAISIVNSTAATQYFNVESPASVLTMPIPASSIFSYNLSAVKRMYLYSAAGTTVYPFPGQNVGEGTTGLYVQAWSNAEWITIKGQNA